MDRVTIPLLRLKKCMDKPDVQIVFDVDDNMYIAEKGTVEFGEHTVTFTMKRKAV